MALPTSATSQSGTLPTCGAAVASATASSQGIAPGSIGIDGLAYSLLFAAFAFGAALGAISMGTMFSEVSRSRMSTGSIYVFAAALAVFGVTTSTWLAFPAVFVTVRFTV